MTKNKDILAAIIFLLVLAGGVIGYFAYFAVHWLDSEPPRFVINEEKWPEPLKQLTVLTPSIRDSVRVYEYDAFIDHLSVWLINGHENAIDSLVFNYTLEVVSEDHPYVESLLNLMPADWPVPDAAECKVYATKGYGYEHQEGLDLFLVIRDDVHDTAIILHEWIF